MKVPLAKGRDNRAFGVLATIFVVPLGIVEMVRFAMWKIVRIAKESQRKNKKIQYLLWEEKADDKTSNR